MDTTKLANLKKLLSNNTKVALYQQKLVKFINSNKQQVFALFADPPLQELLLDKLSSSLESPSSDHLDPSHLLTALSFFISWSSSSKNPQAHPLSKKHLLLLHELDLRFPLSTHLKPVSSHLLKSDHLHPDILELHRERLKVETSDLAREIRGEADDQLLMQLESLQIQMSQIHSYQLQIKYFKEKCEKVFIEICQEMIHKQQVRMDQDESSNDEDEDDDEKEVLMLIAKILETIMGQREYLIKVKSSHVSGGPPTIPAMTHSYDQNQQSKVYIYQDREVNDYLTNIKHLRALYKPLAFGINALITRHTSFKLQSACLRLLRRIQEIFEKKYQYIFEDTIITCLHNIAEMENVKKHKQGALFYYHLLHSAETREEFKEKIRNEHALDVFKYNPNYSSIFFVNQVDQEHPFEIGNIHIQSGYPLEQTIQPKQNFKQYLHVTKANSILHYNFTTQEYNIGFSIERVGTISTNHSAGQKRSPSQQSTDQQHHEKSLLENIQNWEEQNNEEVLRYSICDSHLKQISGSILLSKPGVYKVIWHNSYSYLKAKTLKYRLRILERKDSSTSESNIEEELFTVNELSEKEEMQYRAIKSIYKDFTPFVRIVRGPPQQQQKDTSNQGLSLVLLIEETRSYLRINRNDKTQEQYVQQLNPKELDQSTYNASLFYSEDSPFTQLYIITMFPNTVQSSINPQLSHFNQSTKSAKKNVSDYLTRAEKVLYYTLEKVQLKERLNQHAEFYFADACDALICSQLFNNSMGNIGAIFNTATANILMVSNSNQASFVRDVKDLAMLNMTKETPPKMAENYGLGEKTHQTEYMQMVMSQVEVMFNITNVHIYEDDNAGYEFDLDSSYSGEGFHEKGGSDRLMNMRDEAMKHAVELREVCALLKKGNLAHQQK